MHHRICILGNSGSGKSTLAKARATLLGLAHLDLDTIAWEPQKIGIARDPQAVLRDLDAFLDQCDAWVIEGCYGSLIEHASRRCTELIFLNPGEAVCLAHCQSRAWEPHKYASAAQQQRMLGYLLKWVSAYYTREGDLSLACHQRVFAAFAGVKRELTAPD